MKHILTTAIVAAVATLSAACSSFERDWARAVGDATPARSTSAVGGVARATPEGAWTGTWRSANSGHSGPLRCLVQRPSGSAQRLWSFRYHARFLRVMSAEFKSEQPVQHQANGRFVSEGDWAVPKWAGGMYHYRIEITNTEFAGTYRAGRDHGTLEMKRPVRESGSGSYSDSSWPRRRSPRPRR
jgi:hypothetical protein